MKVIAPITVIDATLSSSTAPETDYAAWNVATAYSIGDRCIRVGTHRIYECLVANTGNIPEDNLVGTTPKWLDIAPTNRWAMFDNVVGTVTSTTGDLTVVLRPGSVSGLALLEVSGLAVVITMKDQPGGTVVYSKTVMLDGTIIDSVYDWFYQPFEILSDVVVTDMPFHYANCELTVSVTSTLTGTAKCGVCKTGEVIEIGEAQFGATASIIDYSRKEKDAFGNYTVVERSFAKRSTMKLETEKTRFNYIFRTLSNLRATPCVWVVTDEIGYEPLTVYGWFKDFSIDVAYPTIHYCSLEIEGLI